QYPFRTDQSANVAADFANRRLQSTSQSSRTSANHLRFVRRCQQRGDVMTKSARSKIDLPQSIEKQEPSLDGRMLKFTMNKFQGRQLAHLQQTPSRRASLQDCFSYIGRQWRRKSFRH